jgi:hypothetical protein
LPPGSTTHQAKSDWHFATKDARIKLKHLYIYTPFNLIEPAD